MHGMSFSGARQTHSFCSRDRYMIDADSVLSFLQSSSVRRSSAVILPRNDRYHSAEGIRQMGQLCRIHQGKVLQSSQPGQIRHLLQLLQPPKLELLERPQFTNSPRQRPELAAPFNRQAVQRSQPDWILQLLQLIQTAKRELLERPQLADSPRQRPELTAIFNRQAAQRSDSIPIRSGMSCSSSNPQSVSCLSAPSLPIPLGSALRLPQHSIVKLPSEREGVCCLLDSLQ